MLFGCHDWNGLTSRAFPQTPLLDNFNKPDGDLTGAWGCNQGFAIHSGALETTMPYGRVQWGQMMGPTQEVYATIQSSIDPQPADNSSNQFFFGLLLKGVETCCCAALGVRYFPADQQADVAVWNTQPGYYNWKTIDSMFTLTLAAGDQLGARVDASGTAEVYLNRRLVVTRQISPNDFTPLGGGGLIGLILSNVRTMSFDDFGGGSQ
jgi:hypothetical protein